MITQSFSPFFNLCYILIKMSVYSCTVGSYASASLCLSVQVTSKRSLVKIHISATFGSWNLVRTLTLMTPRLTLRVKVTYQRDVNFRSHLTILQLMFEVNGHMGQGQSSALKVKVMRSDVISGLIWSSYMQCSRTSSNVRHMIMSQAQRSSLSNSA